MNEWSGWNTTSPFSNDYCLLVYIYEERDHYFFLLLFLVIQAGAVLSLAHLSEGSSFARGSGVNAYGLPCPPAF